MEAASSSQMSESISTSVSWIHNHRHRHMCARFTYVLQMCICWCCSCSNCDFLDKTLPSIMFMFIIRCCFDTCKRLSALTPTGFTGGIVWAWAWWAWACHCKSNPNALLESWKGQFLVSPCHMSFFLCSGPSKLQIALHTWFLVL